MSKRKALSICGKNVVYYSRIFADMINVVDSSTSMSFNISAREFQKLYVPESDPHMPLAARAILDDAPSWYEWRDRRKP